MYIYSFQACIPIVLLYLSRDFDPIKTQDDLTRCLRIEKPCHLSRGRDISHNDLNV